MVEGLPLVSCLCPTYGRPQMLREAIWSFLQQDYPNKELIIVNDHDQPVCLDREYPGVSVYNLPERLANLGEKRNHTVRLARGEILLNWDDDDLYLPWRITDSVRRLWPNPEKWAFKATRAWSSTNNKRYHISQNLFHAQIAMRRSLFDQVGWYAAMNSGQDMEFEARIPKERWLQHPATPSELLYVYRWGNGVAHISGFGRDREGKPTGWEQMAQRTRTPAGGVIRPGFDRDHWQDLLDEAAGLPAVDPTELFALTRRLEPYHSVGDGAWLTDWDPERFVFDGQAELETLFGRNFTMMMNQEAKFLAYLATKAPDGGCFVEIGSRSGKSAGYLARVAANRGLGPLQSIDLWDLAPPRWQGTETLEKFLERMERLGLRQQVTVLKGDSREIGDAWQKPISLLFIDGDHSYDGARADYERFSPHVVPGGIIAFHDYCHNHFPDVRKVIRDVVLPSGLWSDPYELRDHNGIWCARKRGESV
ncbi:MAG TPA: class I SAM-dependent methyltransferase [Symbiobacteriaceae bacterium]|nr:class I SAM-dependent methyltransferase [Symbiobacteriaceae bacterium]